MEFQIYLPRSSKFITRVKWFMFHMFMFILYRWKVPTRCASYSQPFRVLSHSSLSFFFWASFPRRRTGSSSRCRLLLVFNSCHVVDVAGFFVAQQLKLLEEHFRYSMGTFTNNENSSSVRCVVKITVAIGPRSRIPMRSILCRG